MSGRWYDCHGFLCIYLRHQGYQSSPELGAADAVDDEVGAVAEVVVDVDGGVCRELDELDEYLLDQHGRDGARFVIAAHLHMILPDLPRLQQGGDDDHVTHDHNRQRCQRELDQVEPRPHLPVEIEHHRVVARVADILRRPIWVAPNGHRHRV